MVSHALLTTHDTEQPFNLEKVIDIKRFNLLTKLLQVTAFVFRFINKVLKHDSQEANGFILSGSELKEAQARWIKSIRANQFESELRSIVCFFWKRWNVKDWAILTFHCPAKSQSFFPPIQVAGT